MVPSVSHPLRLLLPGALFGAAGFEVLKLIGGYYLSLISDSVTASAFGGAVGLLVWINLVARFAFFTAAWTATLRRSRRCAGPGGARRRWTRRRRRRDRRARARRRPISVAATMSTAAPASASGHQRRRRRRRARRPRRAADGVAAGVGAGRRRRRRRRSARVAGLDQPPDALGARRDGEAPVEQQRRLVGGPQRHVLGVHDADHEPPAVPLGGRDERVPGGVGEPGLAAEVARVGRRAAGSGSGSGSRGSGRPPAASAPSAWCRIAAASGSSISARKISARS